MGKEASAKRAGTVITERRVHEMGKEGAKDRYGILIHIHTCSARFSCTATPKLLRNFQSLITAMPTLRHI